MIDEMMMFQFIGVHQIIWLPTFPPIALTNYEIRPIRFDTDFPISFLECPNQLPLPNTNS